MQYGYLPIPIDYKYIQNFKSSLFEIVDVEQKNYGILKMAMIIAHT